MMIEEVILVQRLDILKIVVLQKYKRNERQHFAICLADFTTKFFQISSKRLFNSSKMFPKHMICYWQFLIYLPLFFKKFVSLMICRITLTCMFLHGFYCIMIEQAFNVSTLYQQSLSLFVLIFR